LADSVIDIDLHAASSPDLQSQADQLRTPGRKLRLALPFGQRGATPNGLDKSSRRKSIDNVRQYLLETLLHTAASELATIAHHHCFRLNRLICFVFPSNALRRIGYVCLVRSPFRRLDTGSYYAWYLLVDFVGATTLENVDEGHTSISLPWEVVAGPGLHAIQLTASNDLNDKTYGDEQTWDGMSDDPFRR
jgi:hypothetical protein